MPRWLRGVARTLGLPLLRFVIEHGVLGPLPLFHGIARAMLAERLRMLGPLIDQGFYLRQFAPGSSRRAAARDPGLHYHFVGHLYRLTPNADFDTIAYRDANPHLSWTDDPLLDFGRRQGGNRAPPLKEMAAAVTSGGTVVTLDHARGGGSSHYLDLLERDLLGAGHRILRLKRVAMRAPLFRAIDMRNGYPMGPVFDLVRETALLSDSLRRSGANRLVVNHMVDLPVSAMGLVVAATRRASVPFDIHLHDYYFLCPRVNLVDAAGVYCGGLTHKACRGCVLREPGGRTYSRDVWREAAWPFLRAAERVFGPSRDLADRYARIWPDLPVIVRNPEPDLVVRAPSMPLRREGEPLKIVILGRLNIPKGFNVVLELARAIRRHAVPVRLVLIGESVDDSALLRQGVTVHGRYRPEAASFLLRTYAPHLVFFPAIWPETWSFVLSVALREGVPVCAFAIGAIAERLRTLRMGTLLPSTLTEDPDLLLQHIIAAASGTSVSGDGS